jgi:hypothetical protein
MSATPLDALRALQAAQWDPQRTMVRMPAGVAPGVDVGHLHSIRETTLGAFLDLEDGDADRAVAALRSVLELQYPLSTWPWSGTFPVTAQQPDPPGDDAVEWVHYDPNWRQFIGCILALVVLHHRPSLPGHLVEQVGAAIARCVHGEPPSRIARWYTNPNLMHAWLTAHVGVATGDDALVEAGEERSALIAERVERYGDVDEYNSPTYDGIDLFALALWTAHPPTERFALAGASIAERMGERISTLYDPGLGTTCGPYIRAYGLDPRRYVSLFGLCAYVAGEPAERVLPSHLDEHTVHVHDLWFLPLLHRLGPEFSRHLHLEPVTAPRTYHQRFSAAIASHLLLPGLAVGWESGRRHAASLDQYAPFTAHVETGSGPFAVGVMVPRDTAWIDVHRTDAPGAGEDHLHFEVVAVGQADRTRIRIVVDPNTVRLDPHGVECGPVRFDFARQPSEVTERTTPAGHEVRVTWAGSDPATGPVTRISVSAPGAG